MAVLFSKQFETTLAHRHQKNSCKFTQRFTNQVFERSNGSCSAHFEFKKDASRVIRDAAFQALWHQTNSRVLELSTFEREILFALLSSSSHSHQQHAVGTSGSTSEASASSENIQTNTRQTEGEETSSFQATAASSPAASQASTSAANATANAATSRVARSPTTGQHRSRWKKKPN